MIETTGTGFPENDWLGRNLHIGPDVVLRVIARTPRCAVPTLEHGALGRDLNALRIPATLNRVVPIDDMSAEPCAGVYADVVRPGAIRVGDVVTI